MRDPNLSNFKNIAAKSKCEPVPQVDVANRVMLSVRQAHVSQSLEREVVWFGSLSVTAACVACIALILTSSDDSLLPIVQPFVTAIQ